MRYLAASAVVIMTALGVAGQDGIYLSVSGGQKMLVVDDLNDTLASMNYKPGFKPTSLNFSGEFHCIMGKRFVLGGKGFFFSQEQSVPAPATRKLKIFGNMGIGSLGIIVLNKKEHGLRLYPQIGAGHMRTNFQASDTIFAVKNENKFNTMAFQVSDNTVVMAKSGFVVDACLALDYDCSFIPAMKCMTGIGTRPMFHAELGYTYTPKDRKWQHGRYELPHSQPELNFSGFYYSAGIGFGFTGMQ